MRKDRDESVEEQSESDSVIPFRRAVKPTVVIIPSKPSEEDVLNLADFLGGLGIETGMEDVAMFQALRIKQGLQKLRGAKPTKAAIEEQMRLLSNWSNTELLEHAKSSSMQDWQIRPAFYYALAEKISTRD